MTSDQIWLRSELMGTQVITRDTGRRLGIVNEVLVDVDRREVVALGLRDNILARVVPGVARYMYLNTVRQIGDVILVDNDEVIEDIDPTPFSVLINSEVVTESGDLLGRVRSFKFNVENGTITALVIGSIGISVVPDSMLSTYELPIEEIVSSGPDRIIVFEGSEEKLQQLTVGVLERLGIGAPPWEKDDDESYILPTISAENQLGTGVPAATTTARRDDFGERLGKPAAREKEWDEDYYEEERPVRQEPRKRYLEVNREEEAWSEASGRDRYDDRDDDRYGNRDDYRYDDRPSGAGSGRYDDEVGNDDYFDNESESKPQSQATPQPPVDTYNTQDNLSGDAWSDESGGYEAQKLELPERQKQPEYEEG